MPRHGVSFGASAAALSCRLPHHISMRHPVTRVRALMKQIEEGETETAKFHQIIKTLPVSELRQLGRELLKRRDPRRTLLEFVRAELLLR